MADLTIFNSESDEDAWVIQINQLVSETNLSILNKMPVCIYQVPKSLSCAKPEAFAPQLIAIGPYTHFRPQLYPMERFKVFAAKGVLDHFKKHDLKQLVEQLRNTGPFIRASYHKYLDFKEDTLLYTMAIDGLFLLDFFHNYLNDQVSGSFMRGIEEQVQISGVKLTKHAIIRDIIMVENQIPTYMLMRILVLASSIPVDSVQEYLGSMLLSFCSATSFKKVKIVLKWTLDSMKKLKDVNIPILQPIKKHLDPILHVSSQLESLSPQQQLSEEEEEAPMIVTIPSVCELHSVGVCFQPSKDGIMTIEFDQKKGIFYLPVLKLDVNSEVIMRNLVAHEALTKPDFLIFTRYTELMRGIIDTVEDVKLLKNAGIIESSSTLSVEESEELFNGMSKSIGPTKTEKLDETIKKVNHYYHVKRKANIYRTLTDYVYSSWKLFTLLATFGLLAMTALQTFCSVYDCPGYFRPK
uniref:UPF0481 protein At3g02645 family n=1 Tax=Cajanus cajan TaxID=3821 RepID=A0A151QP67_CAJCA|nr:Putative UPF0481 protein At3g02645 family [Cajanus cajan]